MAKNEIKPGQVYWRRSRLLLFLACLLVAVLLIILELTSHLGLPWNLLPVAIFGAAVVVAIIENRRVRAGRAAPPT